MIISGNKTKKCLKCGHTVQQKKVNNEKILFAEYHFGHCPKHNWKEIKNTHWKECKKCWLRIGVE